MQVREKAASRPAGIFAATRWNGMRERRLVAEKKPGHHVLSWLNYRSGIPQPHTTNRHASVRVHEHPQARTRISQTESAQNRRKYVPKIELLPAALNFVASEFRI